jgi:hypothetical protein
MNGIGMPPQLLLDGQWMAAQVDEIFSLYAALRRQQYYSNTADRYRQHDPASKFAFERLLLAHEKESERNIAALGANALRFMRHIHHGGLLDLIIGMLASKLKEERAFSLTGRQLLEEVSNPLPQPGQSGLAAGDIQDMKELIETWEAVCRLEDNRIIANWKGQKQAIGLEMPRRIARPRSVADLLEANKFDAITEVVDRPGAVVGDVFLGVPDEHGVVSADPRRRHCACHSCTRTAGPRTPGHGITESCWRRHRNSSGGDRYSDRSDGLLGSKIEGVR